MNDRSRARRGPITRSALGPPAAEACVFVAIATILLTRLYLQLTGYPQIGSGDLHIAHALWGGALMVIALLTGWMALGFGARVLTVVLGGIGFGLFLDEIGKFVTKTNDYFYAPSPEIMYILVCSILVVAHIVRVIRPLSPRECLASAAAIAAEGVARGLSDHRRALGLSLVEQAAAAGAPPAEADSVQALLVAASPGTDRLYRLQSWAPRLIPRAFRSPRLVPWVGWLLVAAAVFGLFFHTLGPALGGRFYRDHDVKTHLNGSSPATTILIVSAVLTIAMALPAMIALRRTTSLWPLRWLRNAALLFTFLTALVDFATEGFAALITLSIGLFGLAILSYQLDLAMQAQRMTTPSVVSN